MNLYLIGHDYRYGVEQMLMTLFPGERPVYDDEPGEDYLVLELADDGETLTAAAELSYGGFEAAGSQSFPRPAADDPLAYDREAQKAVKLAFYKAALDILPEAPRWGSLTGVRPVKIPTRKLKNGGSIETATAELIEDYLVAPLEAEIAAECAVFAYETVRQLEPSAVALYIGIPFCPTRCAYCSFVSAAVGQQLKLLDPYLSALYKEIRGVSETLRRQGVSVNSVYLGGGTPTTLNSFQLKELLEQICLHIDLSRCDEFTIEAGRPDTITAEKLRVMERFPVTRISVNPQSMHDATLKTIGRVHTAEETRRAFAMAEESRIKLINADLIMGLPGEDAADFRESLDEVISRRPANITVHTLAVKRSADFTAHPAQREELEVMYEYSIEALRENGYQPYYLYRQKDMGGSFANIGWTLPGGESLYNLCMMEELCTIVALGATAISKLVNRKTGKIERLNNPKYAAEYVQRIGHIISKKEQTQWLMN